METTDLALASYRDDCRTFAASTRAHRSAASTINIILVDLLASRISSAAVEFLRCCVDRIRSSPVLSVLISLPPSILSTIRSKYTIRRKVLSFCPSGGVLSFQLHSRV